MKLQCCAEDTILQHSSREELCNSVEAPQNRSKLMERDPAEKSDVHAPADKDTLPTEAS